MVIWLSPANPRQHHFVVHRPPFARLDTLLETRSLLLHDLCHYAIEAELGTHEGFYGRVAAGADPGALREASLDEAEWAALLRIEGIVVQLQATFKRRAASGPAAHRLQGLWGAWAKVRPPKGLLLTWPPGPPTVALRPTKECQL